MFESNNRRWVVTPFRYGFWSFTGIVSFNSDSQCTTRLIFIHKDDVVPPDATYVEWNSSSEYGPSGSLQKTFVPSSTTKKTFASFTSPYQGEAGFGCGTATSEMKINMDSYARLVDATEIAKPTYVAPLSIVARKRPDTLAIGVRCTRAEPLRTLVNAISCNNELFVSNGEIWLVK
jgi:hypothetical protein